MGVLVRFSDWPARLENFIEIAKRREFKWGSSDCCLFAADAVREITGEDYAAEFRHLYDTEDAAYALLESYGYGSLRDVITAKLHWPLNIEHASRGDVVVATFRGRETAGICLGIYSAFLKETGGCLMIPTAKCDICWSID